MDKIIAAVGVIGAIAVIIILSQLNLNGFVTAALVILAIAVAIVSIARVKPKDSKPEEVTGK
jgi:hypothetical protein